VAVAVYPRRRVLNLYFKGWPRSRGTY
jgi:hypothetical protein